MDAQQLPLWEEKTQPEHWILCIHFDGSREVISTLDPRISEPDPTVWSAQFVENAELDRRRATRGLEVC